MSAVTAVISYKHIFCILLKREYDCEKKGYWNAYTVYDVLLVHDKNTTHTPHESKYFKKILSHEIISLSFDFLTLNAAPYRCNNVL